MDGRDAGHRTPAKYDVEIVESVVLEIAAEVHPDLLSAHGLTSKIVANPTDTREVETATQAIDNLREFGLISDRSDEIVQLTPAALRAVALLT